MFSQVPVKNGCDFFFIGDTGTRNYYGFSPDLPAYFIRHRPGLVMLRV
jgi:hypothetical protein